MVNDDDPEERDLMEGFRDTSVIGHWLEKLGGMRNRVQLAGRLFWRCQWSWDTECRVMEIQNRLTCSTGTTSNGMF